MRYFRLPCFILTLFLSSQLFAASSSSQTQLNTVNNKIVTLKKTIALKKSQRVKLEKELQSIDTQVMRMTEQLDVISKKIVEKQAILSHSRTQLLVLRKESATQKEILGKQLAASYRLGNHEYVQLLLNQQDPATVQRLMTYYLYINKARVESIAQIQKTDQKIQEEQDGIKKQIEQLTQLSQEAEEKRVLLSQSRAKQQHIMLQLNMDIKSQSSQLKTYEADKKYLTALVERLSRSSTKIPVVKKTATPVGTTHAIESAAPMVYKIKTGAFSQEAHHLIWPTRGKLLNRANSTIMRHQPGIVILAPEGQPVVAVFPGKVVFAAPLKGFGLLMIIDHGQGYMTLYAHNQALYKRRGAMVNAGDLIAAVGHSGILPQSGLYFEIRHFGHPLNPMQWLAASK